MNVVSKSAAYDGRFFTQEVTKLVTLGGYRMDTVQKLLEITSRLEHLECSAEWITRETVQNDNGVAQTGTLIAVLADEIRERVCNLVRDLERQVSLQDLH